MKSPSHFDGKPIGTPTDAKRPFEAGVTMGPDQIERAETARKARNRAAKLGEKNRKKWRRQEQWVSFQNRDEQWIEYRRKRRRAFVMSRSIAKGRSVEWCARVHGISVQQAFDELKWWDSRVRKRYGRMRESKQLVAAVDPAGELAKRDLSTREKGS